MEITPLQEQSTDPGTAQTKSSQFNKGEQSEPSRTQFLKTQGRRFSPLLLHRRLVYDAQDFSLKVEHKGIVEHNQKYTKIDVPKGVKDLTLLHNPGSESPGIISEYQTKDKVSGSRDENNFIPLGTVYFNRISYLDRLRRLWPGDFAIYVFSAKLT